MTQSARPRLSPPPTHRDEHHAVRVEEDGWQVDRALSPRRPAIPHYEIQLCDQTVPISIYGLRESLVHPSPIPSPSTHPPINPTS